MTGGILGPAIQHMNYFNARFNNWTWCLGQYAQIHDDHSVGMTVFDNQISIGACWIMESATDPTGDQVKCHLISDVNVIAIY
jgi:hypothetical protein